MSGHYETVKEMCEEITKILKTGQPVSLRILEHEMMVRYGVGKNLVIKHLKGLQERGFLELKQDSSGEILGARWLNKSQ